MQKLTDKKGVSVVVGYVLLITFGIILSVIAFNYLKTFVPREEFNCPDGVSLAITSYTYDCPGLLRLSIKNNGRFNVDGYHISGTKEPNVNIASEDLSKGFNETLSDDGLNVSGLVYFHNNQESFSYGDEIVQAFNPNIQIYSIQIEPIRLQTSGGSQKIVNCEDAILTQDLVCS